VIDQIPWNMMGKGSRFGETLTEAQQAAKDAQQAAAEAGPRVKPTDWLKGEFRRQNPGAEGTDRDIILWAARTGTPNTEGGWEGGPTAGVGPDSDASAPPPDPNAQFGGALPGDPGSSEPLDGGDEGTLTPGTEDWRNRIPGTGPPPLPPEPPQPPGPSGPAPVPVAGTGRTPMAIHEGYRPGYHGEYQYFKGPDDTTTPSDVMANLGVGAFSEDGTPTGPAPIGIHPEDVETMTRAEIDLMLEGIGGNEPMYTPPVGGIVPSTNQGNPVIPESADGGPIDPRMAAMAPPGMGQPAMGPTEMALSPQEIDMALQELAKAISAGDDNKIDMMFEYFGPELFQQLINMLMGEQRADADGFAANGGLLDDKGAGPRADDLLASVNGDPILLSGDEFVVQESAQRNIGPDNLQVMNDSPEAQSLVRSVMDTARADQMGMMR
jgi:hypothetical protein